MKDVVRRGGWVGFRFGLNMIDAELWHECRGEDEDPNAETPLATALHI